VEIKCTTRPQSPKHLWLEIFVKEREGNILYIKQSSTAGFKYAWINIFFHAALDIKGKIKTEKLELQGTFVVCAHSRRLGFLKKMLYSKFGNKLNELVFHSHYVSNELIKSLISLFYLQSFNANASKSGHFYCTID
jgi:hypothetical protein